MNMKFDPTKRAGFSGHNIRLPDGTVTIPDEPGFIADAPQLHSVLKDLNVLYGGKLEGKSIIDLGCLEGGYALEFAKRGMISTGLEVRPSNYENCLKVKDAFNLPNLNFVNDDCWNMAKYGTFNVTFCIGLLYHLDRPRDFIQLMSSCTKNAIFIHTHFAPLDDETAHALSPMTEHEGIPGRWLPEHQGGSKEDLDKLKWHSWENQKSFWPTRHGLVHAMRVAGFDMVFEQYDLWGGMELLDVLDKGYYKTHQRGLFVGIKSDSLKS